jgi:uncharacterized membrane protein
MSTPGTTPAGLAPAPPGLVNYTHWIYGLHAAAVLSGVLTSGSIMNYARRSDAEGTWLASHFRWQIRTFWFALLWCVVTFVISAPLLLVVIGVYLAMAGLGIVGLWVAYRVIRGWLALRDGQPMPVPANVEGT